MSAPSLLATSPSRSSVSAGLRSSMVRPDRAATHLPPMKFMPPFQPFRVSAALDRSRLDGLEGGTGHRLQLIEVVVVPAPVGRAADVPVAAVVGDDHPVPLQRLEH